MTAAMLNRLAIGHRLKAIVGSMLVQLKNNTEDQFTTIYRYGIWSIRGSQIPKSGPHATLDTTIKVRETLASVITKYKIESMLDACCGDMTWMPKVLEQHPQLAFTGIDVVKELIEKNQRKLPEQTFYSANLIEHIPQRHDLIHCREALNHLKTDNIFKIIENFRKSGSHYFLTNNAPGITRNIDLVKQNGMYRGINWRLPPYSFEPLEEWKQDVEGRTYVLVSLAE